jgi:DnaJ-class molecular chaperone
MEDYYNLLGVSDKASDEEIKKAYRTSSLKHHPDRGGDKSKFQSINEAFQTLGDPQKRKMYDMQKGNPFMGGMPGFSGMGGFPGMGGDMMENPDDFLKMFFGGGIPFDMQGGPRVQIFRNGRPVNMNRAMKPSPINKTINITLEQAYTGVNIPVEVERWYQEDNIKRTETERIYVPIPMGIDNQEIIILENKGNVISDKIKGDVKVFINVENKTEFIRDGLDLLHQKKITLKEALCGFSFDIKHLSGKTYTINNTNGKIITTRYTKTIQHMGMKRERRHPASPMVGNLIIAFEVKFPLSLTDEQREQLSKIL